jgi:hypothetical protein
MPPSAFNALNLLHACPCGIAHVRMPEKRSVGPQKWDCPVITTHKDEIEPLRRLLVSSEKLELTFALQSLGLLRLCLRQPETHFRLAREI